MSFFPKPEKPTKQAILQNDVKMLHTLECQACPLKSLPGNRHPNMEPTGSRKPVVYMLGEAPGRDEDNAGRQFVGKSGTLLRDLLQEVLGKDANEFIKYDVRWNNVVRTRPSNNETPTWHAIECCRPSVQRDIERTKPMAIFGFGNIPLQWVTGYSGIYAYRGRRLPVRIGSHECWFYPMLHPAAILHQQGRQNDDEDDDGDDYRSSEDEDYVNEDHRILKFDLESAFASLEKADEPVLHTASMALDGIEILDQCTDETLDYIDKRLAEYGKASAVGVDYETEALRPYDKSKRILTAAVSDGVTAITIPFDHPEADWSKSQRARLSAIWCNFLRTTKATKTVHNLPFEMEWTAVRFDPSLLRAGTWECTQVQASILDQRYKGSKPGPLSLEFLVLQYFGINIKVLANVDRANLANVPLPHVLQYNGMDARYHVLLHKAQKARLRQSTSLSNAYALGIRRIPTLVLSQVKGMPVDQAEAKLLFDKYTKRSEAMKKLIASAPEVIRFERKYKHPFDPAKHCVKLFFDFLGHDECQVWDKKKKNVKPWYVGERKVNKISVNEEVLTEIGGELCNNLLKLRKAEKRLSTYIVPMMPGSDILHVDGMLHPIFNSTFTDTGRLSAEDPNAQNYPKREDEAKEVRKPIKAKLKHVNVAIDYGQLEARVICMYTKDKVFTKALWEDYDIHGEWAERVAYAIPGRVGGKEMIKDKTRMKKFRTDIKNQWTFPLCFGATLESVCFYLSKRCDYLGGAYKVDPDKLRDVHDKFWEEFAGIKTWQEELFEFYKEHGYVETFTGRRRYGPISYNKLVNAPVQGFAAELVMEGMCRLSETGDPLLQPNLQIHDDLTWLNVPENKVDILAEKALNILLRPQGIFKEVLNVPLTMEMGVGQDWAAMEEIGVFRSNEW